MKNKDRYLVLATLLGILSCSSCTKQKQFVQEQQNLFPLWNGSLPIESSTFLSESKIVCIVQCEPMQLEYEIRNAKNGEKNAMLNERISPFWKYLIKVYSHKNEIRQISDSLDTPELAGQFHLNTGRCLVVISVANRLNSQTAIRVPFELNDDGYAITPRGKDRKLYKILNSALKEWHAQIEADERVCQAVRHFGQYQVGSRDKLTEQGFRSYLQQKNEDPNVTISILANYYGDPKFLENLYKEPKPSPSDLEVMNGTEEPNRLN